LVSLPILGIKKGKYYNAGSENHSAHWSIKRKPPRSNNSGDPDHSWIRKIHPLGPQKSNINSKLSARSDYFGAGVDTFLN
jgi:hypothetical protein